MSQNNIKTTLKKGFTLIELLIVIGILAILATTAVIILNPAQLLAQARDSQRFADLGSLNNALTFYASDVPLSSQDYNAGGVNTALCSTARATTSGSYATTAPTTDSFTGTTDVNPTAAAARLVDGTGWLPVNLTLISIGSPLSNLPVDPTNSADLVYRYACKQEAAFTEGTYELNACLESSKYKPRMGTDGGDHPAAGLAVVATDTCDSVAAGGTGFYEAGTEPGLDL